MISRRTIRIDRRSLDTGAAAVGILVLLTPIVASLA
jgi:hypothetical protein